MNTTKMDTPPKKEAINIIIITGQLKIVVKGGLNHRHLNSYKYP